MDTTLTTDPVCPACGHRHRDAWEWNFGAGLEGNTEHDCDNCGAEFRCERIVDVYYTTRLKATKETTHEQ
jgi:predicted RNA-binding Zn-ribbon protein involved in translation (DUF1610 family)